MKICRMLWVFPLFWGLAFGLFFAQNASAETVIADNAYLFSDEQTEEIRKNCDQVTLYTGADVMIITENDDKEDGDDSSRAKSNQENADRIVGGADTQEDCIVLFVTTKEKSRTCEIFCYGNTSARLTDTRISTITKHMESALSASDYSTAIDTFCDEVTVYLEREPYLDSIWFRPLFQLALCLIAAAAIVGWLLRGARFS